VCRREDGAVVDGAGKTKIREVKLELYVDDELRACLQDILDGKRDHLELNHVYFRHLMVEDFKHEGLKISHIKIPVGRISKVRIQLEGG
jgi:hypothetical protein